ncbi:MAG: hypothetical protein HY010_14445 [Acidobacteria bacterium]|nr:hypothetical protein [Acidobacteriota bacterium]
MDDRIGPDYATKSDDELLTLALEFDSLTEEAQRVLSTELRRRSLDAPERLAAFSAQQAQDKHFDDLNLGRLGLSGQGMGKRLYGRSNVEVRGVGEEYNATLFVVIFFFPLVPTATYRFFREQGSKEFQVLAKKPIDWARVAIVWVKAVAVIAAVPWVFHFIIRLGTR